MITSIALFTAPIIVLAIAYLVALIGLFRKDRDGISALLAILLTIGLIAGVAKERANVVAMEVHDKEEKERKAFEEKDRADRAQHEAERDRQEADFLRRLEMLSLQANSTQTKQEVTKLQQDVTKDASELKIVSIHVGGDDSKSGVFKYDAPPGYRIADFSLIDRSKGGDAHYAISSQTGTHVEVNWSVKSHTIRGPFHTLLNTKTAFLTLDATVKLEQDHPPQG